MCRPTRGAGRSLLAARDFLRKHHKLELKFFWLGDDSSKIVPTFRTLTSSRGIVEDLEAALQQFATIAEDLKR